MKVKTFAARKSLETSTKAALAPVPLNQPIAQDMIIGEAVEIERKLRNTSREDGVTVSTLKQLFNYLKNGTNEISQKALQLLNELVTVKTPALENSVLVDSKNIERFLVPLNLRYSSKLTKFIPNDYLQQEDWKVWNTSIARQNSQDLLKILEPCLEDRIQLETRTTESLAAFKCFPRPVELKKTSNVSAKSASDQVNKTSESKSKVNRIAYFAETCKKLLQQIEEIHACDELVEVDTLIQYLFECISASEGIITNDQDIVTRSRDYLDSEATWEKIYKNLEFWDGLISIPEEIYAKFSDHHKKMAAHSECLGFLRAAHQEFAIKQTLSEEMIETLKNNTKTIQYVFKEILRSFSKGKLAKKGFDRRSEYIDF